MKQVLHIFRKDTRYLWPEILVSLIALYMFVHWSPARWSIDRTYQRWQSMLQLMPLLVFATWVLLAARLVQAENPDGDRQWWVTHPYEWKSLFAAKSLFSLVWIYLPFIVAQAAVLREAGLSPFGYASRWAAMLAVLSGSIILPLLVTAATTSNFLRMVLIACGAVVVYIAATNLANMPRHGYDAVVPNDHHMWVIVLLIVGIASALVLQYATRRTWAARGVAIGTALLAACLTALFTATRDSEIERLYAVSSTAPVQVAMPVKTSTTYIPPVRVGPSERPGMVYVQVPVDFSGVRGGAAVQVDDVKIAIDDPKTGWHWTAPWWMTERLQILPGTHRGLVQIMLTKNQLNHIFSSSATMQMTLAVTELQAGTDATVTVAAMQNYAVPGFGVCSVRTMDRFNQLICRSAMGQPPLTHVSATWYPKECSADPWTPNAPLTAGTWAGSLHAASTRDSMFIVQPVLFNLNPDWHDGNDMFRTVGYDLCPDTVVHFTQYNVTGRARVSLTLPSTYFQMNVRNDGWKEQ